MDSVTTSVCAATEMYPSMWQPRSILTISPALSGSYQCVYSQNIGEAFSQEQHPVAERRNASTYNFLTCQWRMVADDIVHADAHRKRHAFFDSFAVHFLVVQFSSLGVDYSLPKLADQHRVRERVSSQQGQSSPWSAVIQYTSETTRCRKIGKLKVSTPESIRLQQGHPSERTLHRSSTLAPGMHSPIKPCNAKLTILDASWYFVQTSLFVVVEVFVHLNIAVRWVCVDWMGRAAREID